MKKSDSYEKNNADRLAKIMRENLLKRKEQQRARKNPKPTEKKED